MKYITDIHALNLPCSLGTTGDWHASALQWDSPRMLESDCSPFDDWGIETDRKVAPPGHRKFAVANHVRALLDMITLGRFTVAQGMNGVFLDTDEYDDVIFDKVLALSTHSEPNDSISQFDFNHPIESALHPVQADDECPASLTSHMKS